MTAIPHRARRLTLPLAALLAALSAGLVLMLSGGSAAHAHGISHEAKAPTTPKAFAFQTEMRKLWEDHVTWTRLAIVSFAADLPDLVPTEQRLLRNQTDIGNAIKPFYGKAAGAQLTALLREHILIAVDVLTAAKAADAAALGDAQTRWYANADEIATFLSKANQESWPLPMMKKMMREHLDLTTQEAVARLTGDWAADIAAYDRIHRQILKMADMLSSGIVRQFPGRFS
jgi:hypothetical protein